MNSNNAVKIKAFDYIHMINKMMEQSNALPVDYFYYSRLFYDGSRISLSNESRWFKDFTNKYNDIGVVSNSFNAYEEGFLLWPVVGKEEVHKKMYEYGITNQITVVLKHNDHAELFTFATDTTQQSMHNVYINKLDILYNLALIMRDKIKPIIQEVDSDRYISYKSSIATSDPENNDKNCNTLSHYLKQINPNRELVSHLTEREFECLLFLLEGKSAKVISSIMEISQRTVEVHFYNIKKKISCRSITELISKIIKNPFKIN